MNRTPWPTELGQLEGLDLHAQYHSARVGGDFFDALSVGSRVAFFLTDIAGRKEQTHTIAAETQDIFRRRAVEFFGAPDTNLMDATAQLVQEINRGLIAASNGVHYAPTFVGCYDLQLGLLAYINAGGQSAVFRDSDGTRFLGNVSVPMGLFTHFTYEPAMQAFEAGAKLLIVTKGVTESPQGRTQFGVESVIRLLETSSNEPAAEICAATIDAAQGLKSLPWYSPRKLGLGRRDVPDDMTAVAMVRPLADSVA